MFLAIDIGNSDVTVGIYQQRWTVIWRMPSKNQPELYYGLRMQEWFLEAKLLPRDITKVVVSSVVPALTETMANVVRSMFDKEPLIVGVSIYPSLPIKVLNPHQIGSDLVCNAVAAFSYYKKACVVVDFGTALTFTTLNDLGEIIGVAIIPGLKTAFKSLSDNTAQLFDVPLEVPESVLGKNTIHAIQAGIFYGYEGIVSNMIRRIREEVGTSFTTVATGGLCSFIPSLKSMVEDIIPTLTLDGLRLIGEHHPASPTNTSFGF